MLIDDYLSIWFSKKKICFHFVRKKYPGFQTVEKIAWFSGRRKKDGVTQNTPPPENQMVRPLQVV